MTTGALNIAMELTRLKALTIFELRAEWRRLHDMQPPKSLSRELLLLGITYKLQEKSLGGLSKSVLRRISGGRVGRKTGRALTLKPGTRLVREWRGQTHTVLIQPEGVEWRGKRYTSLSRVAREITGAHQSGRRFFGLTSVLRNDDG